MYLMDVGSRMKIELQTASLLGNYVERKKTQKQTGQAGREGGE